MIRVILVPYASQVSKSSLMRGTLTLNCMGFESGFNSEEGLHFKVNSKLSPLHFLSLGDRPGQGSFPFSVAQSNPLSPTLHLS